MILVALGAILLQARVVSTALTNLSVNQKLGGVSPDQFARIATSSTIVVGPQQTVTIFAERTAGCTSRVITTSSQALFITFDDNLGPNSIESHQQATSTTVAYDSAIYGCRAVRARSVASSTIYKSEFGY